MNDNKKGMDNQDLKVYERKIKARFHRWVMNTYGGFWDKASKDVLALTGVEIPAESLRQNIEPVSRKSGMPPRRFKDPKRLKALKDFLISVNYLYEQELTGTGTSGLAAQALSDFLNGDGKPFDAKGFENFQGRFVGERQATDYTESIELSIDYVSPERPVKVTELSCLEYAEHVDLSDKVESEGWAVSNDQGFYMLFLRDAYTVKCNLVLQTSPAISGQAIINDMALLSYESAWASELEKTVTTIHESAEKTEYSLPKTVEDMCLFLTRA